jgi:PRTRC genetic system protein B
MQNSINGIASTQNHVPRSAIVFYGSSEKEDATTFATHHVVRKSGGGFELAPGVTLTSKNLKSLAQQAQQGLKQDFEVIPANVLVANDSLLAWWMPEGTQLMSFDVSMHDLAGKSRLQGVSGNVPTPALVFAMMRNRNAGGAFEGLFVYALEKSERPTSETLLFRAPLLNVGEDGSVCWGDGVKPAGKTVKDIPSWQALFFSSVFTHYNGTAPIVCDDPYAFIADLIDAKAKEFPAKALKPMKRTIGATLSRFGER